ncbi:cytochrome c [Myxococcota bacterium]|nr:cytochrome c [Myxococcota bacterium]
MQTFFSLTDRVFVSAVVGFGLAVWGGFFLLLPSYARPDRPAVSLKKTSAFSSRLQKRRWIAMIDPEKGRQIFLQQGCNACHTVDGKRSVGPTMKGLYGSTLTLQDGRKLLVTEEVLRTAIVDPGRYLVQDYPPTMPTYRGRITEPDISALVAYLITLGVKKPIKPVPSAPPAVPDSAPSDPAIPPSLPVSVLEKRGQQLYLANACWSCHGTKGDGKGPSAKDQSIPPANLRAAQYKCGNRPLDIFAYLTRGSHNPASAMLSYAYIPDADRWALAYYLVSIKNP